MRKIILLFLLAFLGLSNNLNAQTDSINVISKKMKNREVYYPVFSGINNLDVLNKIKQTCETNNILKRIGEGTLQEDATLDLSFTVNYNKNFILCISFFSCSNSGAHPFCGNIDIIFDLKTGSELSFADVFNSERVNDILQIAETQLKKDIEKALADSKNQTENYGCDFETVKSITEGATLNIENLKTFSITKEGINFQNPMSTFYAQQACVPGFSPISFEKLKPFLKITLQ